MFFCSYDELNAILMRNLFKIPKVDMIVGIPRSGMIVANMLSELLNLPVTDLFSYSKGVDTERISATGTTPIINYNNVHTVLLCDDTVASGRAMEGAKSVLKDKNVKIITFVPFALPGSEHKVDLCLQICHDHYFPWNILKRGDILSQAMCDIDGVISPDVPPQYDDDGGRYVDFISNASQNIILQQPVNAFVTGRLEKYRDITETWLHNHNIKYKELIMLPLNLKTERVCGVVDRFKGRVYKNSSCKLFIESSLTEAKNIFAISNKPVFCIETGMLFQ